jgi:hypothetical protein
MHSGGASDRLDKGHRLFVGGDVSVQEHVVTLGHHVDAGDVEVMLKGTEGGADPVGEHSVFNGRIGLAAGEPVAEALEAPALVARRPGHRMSQSAGETPTRDGPERRHPNRHGAERQHTEDTIAAHGLNLHSWSSDASSVQPRSLRG